MIHHHLARQLHELADAVRQPEAPAEDWVDAWEQHDVLSTDSRPFQNGQDVFDLLSTRFKKLWQLQHPTKCFDQLVNGETGNVGCDLEQDAARLAEVDGTEVVAVLLFGWTLVHTDELLRHLRLLCIV